MRMIAFKKEDKVFQVSKRISNDFFTFTLISRETVGINISPKNANIWKELESNNTNNTITKIFSIDVNLHEFNLVQEFCRVVFSH